MRLTKIAVVLLLGILLASGVACGGGPNILVPTVNYVPDGWELEEDQYSGERHLEYQKEGSGSIGISCGPIPGYITQYEEYYGVSTEEALLVYAKQHTLNPEATDKESGMTTVCDHLAAYSQFTIRGKKIKYICFIEEDTFFAADILYSESSVEAEAMALINSITFN